MLGRATRASAITRKPIHQEGRDEQNEKRICHAWDANGISSSVGFSHATGRWQGSGYDWRATAKVNR